MQAALDIDGAFGSRMGKLMRSQHSRCFLARGQGPRPALTEIRLDAVPVDRSPPTEIEDAIVAAVNVGGPLHRANWVDGKPLPAEAAVASGATTFLDMRRANQVQIASPLHSIQFYLPRATLRLVAGSADAELGTLRYSSAGEDRTLHHLAGASLAAFSRPDEASALFLDQLMMAAATHIVATYAGDNGARSRGGLSALQKRLVLEMIESELGGEIALSDLAAICGISIRHFTRAFHQSIGVSPHRWMMKRRIEIAKALLLHSSKTLAEVADESHFAHQSHLTRCFTAAVGTSPGAWRRERRQ